MILTCSCSGTPGRVAISEASSSSDCGPAVPKSLRSVANWNVEQLGERERQALVSFFERLPAGRLRIGTACSGTDSCVITMRHIAAVASALCGKEIAVDHAFACELCPKKQDVWVMFCPPSCGQEI